MSVRDYRWLKKRPRQEKKKKLEIIYIYKSKVRFDGNIYVRRHAVAGETNRRDRGGPIASSKIIIVSILYKFSCRVKRRFAHEMFPGETFISAL